MQQWDVNGVGTCGGRVLLVLSHLGMEMVLRSYRDGRRSVLGCLETGWVYVGPHRDVVEMVFGQEWIGWGCWGGGYLCSLLIVFVFLILIYTAVFYLLHYWKNTVSFCSLDTVVVYFVNVLIA